MTDMSMRISLRPLAAKNLPENAKLCKSIPPGTHRPDMTQEERRPSAIYEYRNADGTLACLIARYQTGDSKRICPFTVWETEPSVAHWAMKGLPDARPVYRLPELQAHPDRLVLLSEGEKCAEAVTEAFPGYVSTTWMGGSNAVNKTDFAPLKNRDVIILPDDDAAGQQATETLIASLKEVGVKRLRYMNIEHLAKKMAHEPGKGFDIADAIDAGLSEPQFNGLIGRDDMVTEVSLFDNIIYDELWRRFHFKPDLPPVFQLSEHGIIKIEVDPRSGVTSDVFAGSPMVVLGRTRLAGASSGWGYQVAVRTPVGEWTCKTISGRLLAGDGREMREILAEEGFIVPQQLAGRRALGEYIAYAQKCPVIQVADRPGWHENCFTLPDVVLSPTNNKTPVAIDMGDRPHFLGVAGTSERWKELAVLAAQSSRATFVICAALAAPLLRLMGMEGGGFHLHGRSSRGKTSLLIVAGSVWGGGGKDGFVRSWRTTDNGAEALIADHNDLLLPLDEMTLASPETVFTVLYMLANGHAKNRAKVDGRLAAQRQWLSLVLSSGEHPTSRHLEQGRGWAAQMTGGLAVRMVDIPFEFAPEVNFEGHVPFDSEGAFVENLTTLAKENYGHAGRMFIQEIMREPDTINNEVKKYIARVREEFLEPDDDPQVERVIKRFGVVAAAGCIAAGKNILPISSDEIMQAVGATFRAWKKARGGGESEERRNALRHLKHFFEAHGPSRFEELIREKDTDQTVRGNDRSVRDRCGYRVKQDDDAWLYYVLPVAWEREVCGTHAPELVAKIALDANALQVGEGQHRQKKVRLPDFPEGKRVYAIRPDMLP
jgi:putative DNA primase/helicase